MRKILIVDDEAPISDIIAFTLKEEGYGYLQAYDGEEALKLFRQDESIDLVLLDLMLPKIDGLEVCREIRKTSNVPIIMLTAKKTEFDKVLGLELGADDYITKPFSNRELVARIKANLRRGHLVAAEPVEEKQNKIVVGDLTVHEDAYRITKYGKDVELTHREFELFHYLAQHIDQVMTREDLLETVWGYDYFGDVRTVDVTIRRLREKIEDEPSKPTYIMTRRGVGYYLSDPTQEA